MAVWNPWKPIPPWWLVVFFAVLALGACCLPLPEILTIRLAMVAFAVVTVLQPLNGVSFLLLVIPFFLGNAYKPYQFLLEIFVYGTLLSMLVRLPRLRRGNGFPLKIPILLVLLSAVVSWPLNSREIYYHLWALPFRDLFHQWLYGNPGAALHPLRVLTNLASAAALAWLTFRALDQEPLRENFVRRQIQALVLMGAAIAGIGLLLLFDWLPRGRTYASLSLVGVHEGAITAFAFNRQFLAQYLLLCLPLAVYWGKDTWTSRRLPGMTLSVVAIALVIFALAASMQRSVYIVLALQAGFMLVGYG
jgi:hypothetical protein